MVRFAVLVVSAALLFAGPAIAAGPVMEVRAKDAAFKSILGALMPAVAEDVGLPVTIAEPRVKTQDGFAFVSGKVTAPDGSDIDFSETNYAAAVADGMFDGPNLWAYLKLADGRWTVLEQDIGPTDAWFMYWPESHGGSCELTGLSAGC